MDVRQLRFFVAVAEELHFGRAAARLHISKPPLTVHIQRLVQQLGAPLFGRTSRQVQLTAAGILLYPRAVAILDDVEQASADVGLVASGQLGHVRLGFVSSASYEVVPFALREERIVAVIPADQHLTTKPVLDAEDLAEEPLILFPFTSMPGFVAKALEVFREHGSAPQVVQQVINQENVMGLVAAGVGISLLPESFSSVQHPRAVTRGLSTAPTSLLQLAHPRTGLTSAATVLRDLLRSQRPQDSADTP